MASRFRTSPVTPFVLRIGNDAVVRYVITDQRSRFWTGSSWTKPGVRKRALLFNSLAPAQSVQQTLALSLYGHLPVTHFSVPLIIQLWTNRRLSMLELGQWIGRNTNLTVNSRTHGLGPVPGSYARVTLDFGHLAEPPSRYSPAATLCVPTRDPAVVLSLVPGIVDAQSWLVSDEWERCWQSESADASDKTPTHLPTLQSAYDTARNILGVKTPPARTLHMPMHVSVYATGAIPALKVRNWFRKAVTVLLGGWHDQSSLLHGAIGISYTDFSVFTKAT